MGQAVKLTDRFLGLVAGGLRPDRDEVARQALFDAYARDPAGFVRDCIHFRPGEGPTAYQLDVLEALPRQKRIAVRGPHGIGKSCLAAWVVLWGVLTAGDVKVVTTASAWRQLTRYLWPEIHKWGRRLRWDRLGRPPFTPHELLALSLKLGPTRQAFAAASDNPDLIEGAHARRIVYVFDEAKAIPDATWDAAEGAFAGAGADTGAEAYALAISTPGAPSGRFHDIHARKAGYGDWWTRHVTLAEGIAAGRVSREWAEKRKVQWGQTSPVYQNRVLGEFADSSDENVIPLAWVYAAIERWHACEGQGQGRASYGCDPARYGEDRTAIARLAGRVCERIDYHHKEDTMQTTGRIAAAVDRKTPVAVDVIGIGAGVVDRLKELGYTVVPVNVANSTDLRDASGELQFVDLRSALWWALRDNLDPAGEQPLALPDDPLLVGDLTAPRWTYTSRGRIRVEGKEEIRKRLKRSTDGADALALAWYAPRSRRMRRSGDPDVF